MQLLDGVGAAVRQQVQRAALFREEITPHEIGGIHSVCLAGQFRTGPDRAHPAQEIAAQVVARSACDPGVVVVLPFGRLTQDTLRKLRRAAVRDRITEYLP